MPVEDSSFGTSMPAGPSVAGLTVRGSEPPGCSRVTSDMGGPLGTARVRVAAHPLAARTGGSPRVAAGWGGAAADRDADPGRARAGALRRPAAQALPAGAQPPRRPPHALPRPARRARAASPAGPGDRRGKTAP